ncbi:MAG: 6-carboxytetrahydropterin synthase [Planctomycetota bacterium]
MSGRARTTTIRVDREVIGFVAGHFTIFGESQRERLHGHNFDVSFEVDGEVDDNGMLANYSQLRRSMRDLTQELDEYFLLPSQSPHLRIERDGEMVYAHFAGTRIPFLAEDVLVLPVVNVTLEELARYLTEQFIDRTGLRRDDSVLSVTVRVSSKPGQDASFTWRRER